MILKIRYGKNNPIRGTFALFPEHKWLKQILSNQRKHLTCQFLCMSDVKHVEQACEYTIWLIVKDAKITYVFEKGQIFIWYKRQNAVHELKITCFFFQFFFSWHGRCSNSPRERKTGCEVERGPELLRPRNPDLESRLRPLSRSPPVPL